MQLWNIRNLPYGKIRRHELLKWFTEYRYTNGPYTFTDGLPINRKHQFQDRDPDIKYLIKKGVLTRHRPNSKESGKYGKSGGRSHQTYLVLTNDK